MSSFHLAIRVILKHEGIFSDDPQDSGGPTKYGISLRYLKLSGQGDFDQDGDIDRDDILKMNLEDAKEIYKQDWWERYSYYRIQDQFIATKVFDLSVNMGAKQAHKILQRAIWAVLGDHQSSLSDDGILGPKTLHKVNSLNNRELMPALRAEAAGFYRSLRQPKYLKGWLNRAYA